MSNIVLILRKKATSCAYSRAWYRVAPGEKHAPLALYRANPGKKAAAGNTIS